MTGNTESLSDNTVNDIGKRIKLIRKRKGITQHMLAGDRITRNMLSRIENGFALPSIPTLVYIAMRLDVPCACLLDDNALSDYSKAQTVHAAREYMKNGEHEKALKLINSSGIEIDDELAIIIIECELSLSGRLCFERKYLEAQKLLTDAIKKTGETVYSTAGSGYIASLYRALAVRMLPNELKEESDPTPPDFDRYIDLYIYIRLLDFFDNGQIVKAVNLASMCEIHDRILSAHIAAVLDMANGRYSEAESKLLLIIESEKNSPSVHGSIMLYRIYDDLEKCAKGKNDYVLAYTYKEEKIKLYSQMSGVKL
ncbi:MAG: helix-turn-helix transcriptional regulator [Clostridia bacterium]|nr:helix-turn-helix transcriptional regulator [Clostridia bacterium]